MPDNVSQDQCETRRLHCGEAMTSALRRQETQFNGFLARIEEKIDPLVRESTTTSERCKSNTHRINWAWGILGSIIVALVVAGIIAVVQAL